MFQTRLGALGSAVLLALVAAMTTPAQAADKLSKKDKRWLEEEVAALITAEEIGIFKEISSKDRKRFKELFWARRDFNPMTPENEFREEFEARVTAANQNFKSRGRKGSATDMGKVFLLLGAPSETNQGERGGSEGLEAGAGTIPASGGGAPGEDPSPGGGGVGAGLGLGRPADRSPAMTWVYAPDPRLGIPEGLTVQFRSRSGFGFRMVKSKAVGQALERVKARYISNPSINYARDEKGRLMKPPAEIDPNSPAKQILQALRDTQTPSEDIPFQAMLAFFRANEGSIYVPILFQVEAAPLSWDGDEVDATVFGVIENDDGHPIYQFEEQTSLTKAGDGASYEIPVQLQPGEYTLYLGVRDDQSALAGTKIMPLEVPDFSVDELKLSSVLLFSDGQKTENNIGQPGRAFLIGGYHFVPKRGNVYRKSENLSGVFNAYGYGVEEGKPNLTVQYIFFKEGRRRGQTKDEPFVSAGPEIAITVFDIPLSGFSPGEYKMQIKVTDHVRTEVLKKEIEFQLVGDEPDQ
ncbi:MAG: GWxTD domain-containing protein [Acidobacteriota bacterium]